MEKYCTAGRPHYSMAHAHCVPNAEVTTLIMCSTYCFSTATLGTGARLSVALYVNCLSFVNS